MPYTSGWKPTEIENPSFKCSSCGSTDIQYRDWESGDGAHDDTHYKCACGHEWWVEGIDA